MFVLFHDVSMIFHSRIDISLDFGVFFYSRIDIPLDLGVCFGLVSRCVYDFLQSE